MSEFGSQMTSDTFAIQKLDTSSQNNSFKSVSLMSAISNIELILKLNEEFQTTRSIGVSPQHSVIDLSSPSINEKYSIDFRNSDSFGWK